MSTVAHHASITLLVARLGVQEAVRGRALAAVGAVSVLLMALFAFAADQAMDRARRASGTLTVDVIGASLLGTAAFVGLLLGAVLAVFLSHSSIRGDADRGLLQPLLVRPVPRSAIVLGRLLAGGGVAALYTAALWAGAVVVLEVAGEWSPPQRIVPGAALASAVALVALAAVAISTVLPAMASGAVTLTLVGLGFTAGLVAQLGESLGLASLIEVADAASIALPFEALYRHVLFTLSGDLGDLERLGIAVGPFGGAGAGGAGLVPLTVLWALLVGAFAVRRASRLDT